MSKQITRSEDRSLPVKIAENRQVRNYGLLLFAVVLTLGISAFFVVFQDRGTTVTLINDGDCPQALITFTSVDAGTVQLVAGPGESVEADIIPDVDYEYELTTESEEADENNMACFDRDSGIFRPERGTNTNFRIESQQRPVVVFELDEQCAPATITIVGERDTSIDPVELAPGERFETEISANQVYTYDIELVTLATENLCESVEGATIELQLDESDTIRIAPVE